MAGLGEFRTGQPPAWLERQRLYDGTTYTYPHPDDDLEFEAGSAAAFSSSRLVGAAAARASSPNRGPDGPAEDAA